MEDDLAPGEHAALEAPRLALQRALAARTPRSPLTRQARVALTAPEPAWHDRRRPKPTRRPAVRRRRADWPSSRKRMKGPMAYNDRSREAFVPEGFAVPEGLSTAGLPPGPPRPRAQRCRPPRLEREHRAHPATPGLPAYGATGRPGGHDARGEPRRSRAPRPRLRRARRVSATRCWRRAQTTCWAASTSTRRATGVTMQRFGRGCARACPSSTASCMRPSAIGWRTLRRLLWSSTPTAPEKALGTPPAWTRKAELEELRTEGGLCEDGLQAAIDREELGWHWHVLCPSTESQRTAWRR